MVKVLWYVIHNVAYTFPWMEAIKLHNIVVKLHQDWPNPKIWDVGSCKGKKFL
jgi:hypothetical protein